MEEAKRLLKKLLIVPVVVFFHIITMTVFLFFASYFWQSTFQWGYTIGNVFMFLLGILSFPRNILATWFPSIDGAFLPFMLTSLLWGVAAYVVILICHYIKRVTR